MAKTPRQKAALLNDVFAEPTASQNQGTQKLQSMLSKFEEAKAKASVLYGTIAGVEEIEGSMEAYLVIYDGPVKLYMPFKELFRDYPIDLNTIKTENEHLKRQKQMAMKLIGAYVPYRVMKMTVAEDGQSYHISVSRKTANQKRVNHNFIMPMKGGEPLLEQGSVVDADIVTVGANAIMVNIGGIDTIMQKWDMSYKPLGDLSHEMLEGHPLAPGYKLRVQISSLKRTGHNTLECKVSHKAIERLDAQEKQIPEGTICLGTVSKVTQNSKTGQVKIHCWIKHYEVPATATYTPGVTMLQPCSIGTEVRLKVGGFWEWDDQERAEQKFKTAHPNAKTSPQLDVGIYKCYVLSIGPTSVYGGLY